MKINGVLVGISVLILLALFVFFNLNFSGNVVASPSNYDSLVECLNKNNVVLYGYGANEYVSAQKKLFGESAKNLKYIDCLDFPEECSGIMIYPSWRVGDVLISGAATPGALSHFAGCEGTNS